MTDGEAFGARLKELREAAKMSRQELADRSGVARGSIRDLEQGKGESGPHWKTVVALTRALGVSCEDFLTAPAGKED